MQTMAVWASLPFWLSAIGAMWGGWWSDRLIAQGKSPTSVRRGFAAGAFLTGQSTTAVRTRHSLAAGIGWLRGSAEHAGWRTGPVGTWVYANKQLLRIAAVALAALALVFWGQPTGKSVALLAGLLLVALALIEFLGQPPQRTIVAPQPRPEPGSGSSTPKRVNP